MSDQPNMSTPDSAVFLAYLWQSFIGLDNYEPYDCEIMSDGGELEGCFELSAVADVADHALTELAIADGLPGVFHYEKMDEFAQILHDHLRSHQALPNAFEVNKLIIHMVKEWRAERG